MTLGATPAKARVGGPIDLSASGGSGHYAFGVEPGGSGGEVRGTRFIAGYTPGTDQLFVRDVVCEVEAVTTVEILAAFGVAPARATVRPGTSFRISTNGTLGAPAFTALQNGSGGSVSGSGQYTAGSTAGVDLIEVRDSATGEQALLRYEVKPAAAFRAWPARLALPAGSSIPLETIDGTDSVTWRKVSGPGAVSGALFSVERGATGATVLEAEDAFTGLKTSATVRVLDELTRTSKPHGRLTDFATTATGDFDGDGVADLAVGYPESDLSRPSGGAVLLFKGSAAGLTEKATWTLLGTSDTAQYGAVLAAGDLDGDGRADLAISSPGADVTFSDSGALYLYKLGQTGPVEMRGVLTGLGRGGFGTSLAIADVDGDGDQDLVVGSPGADLINSTPITRRGVIDVFLLEKGKPIPDLGALRVSGMDLAPDGTVVARRDIQMGRQLVAADLNADGKTDLAFLGTVNNSLLGGVPLARAQPAVQVHFNRGGALPFDDTADAYILPTNTADGSEGTYRLGFVAGDVDRPPLLLVSVDAADSPDLRGSGGNNAASDNGGVLLFNLSSLKPAGPAPPKPAQFGRTNAWATFFGEGGGHRAGRSWAVLDSGRGPELLLGAPYASATVGGQSLRLAGKVIAYPLSGLTSGTVRNKGTLARAGAATDCLGAGLATWALPGGTGLVAVASRASPLVPLTFTGRVDSFERGAGDVTTWAAKSAAIPAAPAVQLFGQAVAAARGPAGAGLAVVAAPGFSGPGSLNDGNDFAAGIAWAYPVATPAQPVLLAEGSSTPLVRSGRNLAPDVTFTDFDGDGRQDAVVAAPSLVVPAQPATDAGTADTNEYEQIVPGCLAAATQSTGGFQVHLQRADGTFRSAFRVWAPLNIAGCTPAGSTACRRGSIGRAVAGGFDFDGDGKQDVAAVRTNGFDVFLGQAPDGTAKLTMACSAVFTSTHTSTTSTAQLVSAPAGFGDLDADGCDEVAYRYVDTNRSGIVVVFGFDPGGVRCGGRSTAASLRISGDTETGSLNYGLGVATARAGRVYGGAKDYVAVGATSYIVNGRTQSAVLLFDVADIAALRPATGTALVGVGATGLVPKPVVLPERTPTFGGALAGNVDLTGDGVPELVVGAPGATLASDGGGALYVLSWKASAFELILTAAGDVTERGFFASDIALQAAAGGNAPYVLIGAPRSYRTGTQNGTAFALPLTF